MVAESNADSELLTTDQVCDRLVQEPALRPAAAMCVLPTVPVDGGVRFRRADLEAWIARERLALARRGGHAPGSAGNDDEPAT